MLSPRELRDPAAATMTQYRSPLRNKHPPLQEVQRALPYLMPNLKSASPTLRNASPTQRNASPTQRNASSTLQNASPTLRKASLKQKQLESVNASREGAFNRSFAVVKRYGEAVSTKVAGREKKSPDSFLDGKVLHISSKHNVKERSLELPLLKQGRDSPKMKPIQKGPIILTNKDRYSKFSVSPFSQGVLKLPQLDLKKAHSNDRSRINRFEKRQSMLNESGGQKAPDDSGTVSGKKLSLLDSSLVETSPGEESFSVLLDLQKDDSFERSEVRNRKRSNNVSIQKSIAKAHESQKIGWKRIIKGSREKIKIVEKTLDEELEKTNELMAKNDSALKSFIQIRSALAEVSIKEKIRMIINSKKFLGGQPREELSSTDAKH